ncbi:MAG: hypothetical protein WC205_19285 [Opitutaceae bacterium]|jgi:hypothetical protein
MKTKITLATLLLAAISPALHANDGTPGKIGDVTFALVVSYETGGFDGDYEKSISNSATLGKYQEKGVIAKEKLSNTELIQTWLEDGPLGYYYYEMDSVASDWTLKMVDISEADTEIDTGLFAVSEEFGIVYIGTFTDYYGPAVYMDDSENSVEGYLYTYTEKRSAYDPVSAIDTATYKGSFVGYFNMDIYDENANLTGLYSYSGSSKTVYTDYVEMEPDYFDFASQVETYKVAASSITGILGDVDGDQLTGSIKFSALQDSSDVGAYVSAFNDYYND